MCRHLLISPRGYLVSLLDRHLKLNHNQLKHNFLFSVPLTSPACFSLILSNSSKFFILNSCPTPTSGQLALPPVAVVQSLSRVWLFATHGLQPNKLPCPSPSPIADSNSFPLSQWCHPTISSSVIPLSSCLQSFPASESIPMSRLFASGGQSIGATSRIPWKSIHCLQLHHPCQRYSFFIM